MTDTDEKNDEVIDVTDYKFLDLLVICMDDKQLRYYAKDLIQKASLKIDWASNKLERAPRFKIQSAIKRMNKPNKKFTTDAINVAAAINRNDENEKKDTLDVFDIARLWKDNEKQAALEALTMLENVQEKVSEQKNEAEEQDTTEKSVPQKTEKDYEKLERELKQWKEKAKLFERKFNEKQEAYTALNSEYKQKTKEYKEKEKEIKNQYEKLIEECNAVQQANTTLKQILEKERDDMDQLRLEYEELQKLNNMPEELPSEHMHDITCEEESQDIPVKSILFPGGGALLVANFSGINFDFSSIEVGNLPECVAAYDSIWICKELVSRTVYKAAKVMSETQEKIKAFETIKDMALFDADEL